MGLRMKDFNIFEVHWKIWFLEGGSQKTNRYGWLSKKGELGKFAGVRGVLVKREHSVFEGVVDTPMHTMTNG